MTPAQIDDCITGILLNITQEAAERARRFGSQASLERLEQLAADRELIKSALDRLTIDRDCGF
jgi:hypothetical protein